MNPGWFNFTEPLQTTASSEASVGVFYISLDGFTTEPRLTAYSLEEQGVEGNCTPILGGSTALHLVELYVILVQFQRRCN